MTLANNAAAAQNCMIHRVPYAAVDSCTTSLQSHMLAVAGQHMTPEGRSVAMVK